VLERDLAFVLQDDAGPDDASYRSSRVVSALRRRRRCAEHAFKSRHVPNGEMSSPIPNVRDRCPSTVSRSEVSLFALRDREDVCTSSRALCWWMSVTDPRSGTNSNTAPELRSQPCRTCPNDEAGGTSRVRLDVVSFRSVTCNAKDHGWRTRAVKGSPFSSWLNWQQLSPSFRLP